MDADIQNYSGHIVTSREGRVSRNPSLHPSESP